MAGRLAGAEHACGVHLRPRSQIQHVLADSGALEYCWRLEEPRVDHEHWVVFWRAALNVPAARKLPTFPMLARIFALAALLRSAAPSSSQVGGTHVIRPA